MIRPATLHNPNLSIKAHGDKLWLSSVPPQGKSRSATAVISYVMASQGKSFEESLSLVQRQRKMAEPNPTFTRTLKVFEKSQELRELRTVLGSNS